MSNNLVTKSDLGEFYSKILPYLGSWLKLAGPVGMIISYMGTTAPSGYLACDGSWYDIGDYPKLANWMMDEFNSYSYFALSGETVQSGKFKVPDLRGEFLRGTGTNSHANQGSGANVGVHQDGTKHVDILTNNNKIYVRQTTTSDVVANGDHYDGCTTWLGYTSPSTGTFSSAIDGMFTSRPTNTSVLYCIKYEEYEGDGAGEVYSTDERVVGKWIGGETIYQKTVNCGTLPNNTTKSVAHGISNLSHIIRSVGWTEGDGLKSPLPYVAPSSDLSYSVSIRADTTNIIIQTSGDLSSFTTSYVTLQYTKTT